jgi:hypothetical protein
VFLWWGWSRPPCILRTIVVNLKDEPDAAIRGVLWSARGPWLVLRNASALPAGAGAAPIDGEVVIHYANVQFIQILPDASS